MYMYRYEKDADKFVFDGDFKEFLLNIGVDKSHIMRMMEKNLQGSKEYYCEYGSGKVKKMLVPLSKVIGTSRGTIGVSVFDNVRIMAHDERNPSKFETCFGFLKDMSLEDLRDSYKTVRPVKMNYYIDDDEYYLTSDGNHRTLTAMVLGAEYINADVTFLQCDFSKKERCLAVDEFYKKYNIDSICDGYLDIEIVFNDGGKLFSVSGFPRRTREDCFEYINKLSEEIELDLKKVKKLRRFPSLAATFFAKVFKDNRILQYFGKFEPSQDLDSIDISSFVQVGKKEYTRS